MTTSIINKGLTRGFKALMSNVKPVEDDKVEDNKGFKALMSNVKQYKYKLFISLKNKKINIKVHQSSNK